MADGFDFSPGWALRAPDFGRTRPYPLTAATIRTWAKRYCDGDSTSRLVGDARRLRMEDANVCSMQLDE
ncbi:MAG: hypothetical protein LC777_06540 [Actinobacteria bacterium]|nr:hypothetical protein [Actinomycetota bacterium]